MSNLENNFYEGPINANSECPVFPETAKEIQGNLLAAFNASPKAIVYLLIPPGGISARELNRAFLAEAEGTLMEQVTENIAWRYCTQSLCQNGLITIENGYDDQGSFDYYVKRNSEAEPIAEAAAVMSMHYEMASKLSLRQVLGKTATPSKNQLRAPVVRTAILQWLSENPQGGEKVDMQKALGISSSTLGFNLVMLGEQGLIQYDSIHTTSGRSIKYQINQVNSNEVQSGRERPFHNQVKQLIERFSFEDREISQKTLTQALLEEGITGWNSERALGNYIGKILKEFSQEGYLERLSFTSGKKSSAKITEQGQMLVDNFLNLLTRISEGDQEVLEWINAVVKSRVLNHFSRYVGNSLDLYYPYSTSFRITQRATDFVNILKFIRSNKSGVSILDIARQLQINPTTIRSHLLSLEAIHPLTIIKHGKVNYYCFEPNLEETLEQTALSSKTKRLLKYVDKVQEITLQDKIAILCYAVWTGNASIKKTAEKLGLSQSEVSKYIDQVVDDTYLTEKYGEIFDKDNSRILNYSQ